MAPFAALSRNVPSALFIAPLLGVALGVGNVVAEGQWKKRVCDPEQTPTRLIVEKGVDWVDIAWDKEGDGTWIARTPRRTPDGLSCDAFELSEGSFQMHHNIKGNSIEYIGGSKLDANQNRVEGDLKIDGPSGKVTIQVGDRTVEVATPVFANGLYMSHIFGDKPWSKRPLR